MNQNKRNEKQFDLAVAGGGLAGLSAALLAQRAGKSVIVLEKAGQIGGRGRTTRENGFNFNLGAHAIYNNGPAAALFEELGLKYGFGQPDISGVWLRQDDTTFPLPLGPASLMKVKTMGPRAKLEMALIMGKINKSRPEEWRGRSVGQWLQTNVKHASVADVLRILFTLTSYAGDVADLDMGLFLEQWKVGGGGVRYVDGGWGVLVDELKRKLVAAGVVIETNAPVQGIDSEGDDQVLRYGKNEIVRAAAVILAQDPAGVKKILGVHTPRKLEEFLQKIRPVRAAALDIGISALPGGPRLGILDMGRRLYGLCHTPTADLAPVGMQVLHGLKYLKADENGAEYKAELEELFDLVRPGWRDKVQSIRFLPNMTVSHALLESGIELPGVRMAADRAIYACGDWVCEGGMLLDASMASVRRAMADFLESGAAAGRARPLSRAS